MNREILIGFAEDLGLGTNVRELLCVCGSGCEQQVEDVKRKLVADAIDMLTKRCWGDGAHLKIEFFQHWMGSVEVVGMARFTGCRFDNIDELIRALVICKRALPGDDE